MKDFDWKSAIIIACGFVILFSPVEVAFALLVATLLLFPFRRALKAGLAKHSQESLKLTQEAAEQQKLLADQSKIDAVVTSYVAKIDRDYEPDSAEARFDWLVRSGLPDLDGVPEALPRLTEALIRKGKQNAIPADLDTKNIFSTAMWAITREAYLRNPADFQQKYLDALLSSEGGPPMPWAIDAEMREDLRVAKRAAQSPRP
jgi:hypothetical protein